MNNWQVSVLPWEEVSFLSILALFFSFFFNWCSCQELIPSAELSSPGFVFVCSDYFAEKCPSVIPMKKETKQEIWLMNFPLMWGCASRLGTREKPWCWGSFSKCEDICMCFVLWNGILIQVLRCNSLIAKLGGFAICQPTWVVISH